MEPSAASNFLAVDSPPFFGLRNYNEPTNIVCKIAI